MSRDERLPALHSLAEAYLYVRVTPCRLCAGPLDAEQACFKREPAEGVLSLTAECRTCETELAVRMDASGIEEAEWSSLRDGQITEPWEAGPAELNPGGESSQVIDLNGWLTLFTWLADESRLAAERARTTRERERARNMRLVAGRCLDEALKFFDDDNELPPDEAFFHDAGRRQFWERPELFTRRHLADLRFSLMRSGH